ncbi:hypothetical protein OPV22_026498 [Ensete ventricosum]|uniref:Myb-like domain-containing protein n=1 Tax=Ensete ventricosum TaxID=4639 RepID=A0AAV8P912_ENSVE|nr:hypothetical protein OPV22_026498 [Ensete ventricosum]
MLFWVPRRDSNSKSPIPTGPNPYQQETSRMKLRLSFLATSLGSILAALYRVLRSSKPDAHKKTCMYTTKALSRWSLDQPTKTRSSPLSSNRYYVLVAKGRKRGKAYTCSKEDIACCSCQGGVKDAKPRAFDHRNVYQVMVEIKDDGNGKFTAKSVAPDGHPPSLLGREHWKLYASKPKHYALRKAWGLNAGLRACLPDLNFPISAADGPKITVGRWYCPFMFVKEACRLQDQMKRSMFYEISLEQFWQQVYACENHSGHDMVVEVNALFGSLLVMMDGGKGVVQDLWERIKWEQGRGGWIADEEERIVRLERFQGMNGWKKFACYVLVERFVLKRMDGSLVLTFDFRHSIKLRSRWE